MKAADFSRYIKDPAQMQSSALAELSQLVKDFPYFQPAHLLLTLASKKFDTNIYQQSLKKTAIVATSRTRLFELIAELEGKGVEEQVLIGNRGEELQSAKTTEKKEKDTKELQFLKIAEEEALREEETKAPETQKSEDVQKNDNKKEAREEKETEAGEQVEKEISRQVVSVLVEKQLQRAVKQEETGPAQVPGSFGDWLAYMKKNNGQPYFEIEKAVNEEKQRQGAPQPSQDELKQKKRAIIDEIIDKNPGHIRIKEESRFFSPETRAKESLLENEHLVTETLARIFALQGNTGKAIRAYQILSLKYPQKSAYFAGLIKQLKNNNKTE